MNPYVESDDPMFIAICKLAESVGVSHINKLPAAWEHQIDDQWWIAINGHKSPVKCTSGVNVPPFSCYVQYNGWPAGIIDPYGGVIAAGECANEETFFNAIKKAVNKPKPSPEPIKFQRRDAK